MRQHVLDGTTFGGDVRGSFRNLQRTYWGFKVTASGVTPAQTGDFTAIRDLLFQNKIFESDRDAGPLYYDFANNQGVVMRDGIYRIGGSFYIKDVSDGASLMLYAKVNAVYTQIGTGRTSGTFGVGTTGVEPFPLLAGDTVRLAAYCSRATNSTLDGGITGFYMSFEGELG